MKHTNSCSKSQEQWCTKCKGPEGTNRISVPAPITISTFQGLRSPIATPSGPIHPWSSDAATSASLSGSGQPALSPDYKQVELARIPSHRCMCLWCRLDTSPSQHFSWNGTSFLPFSCQKMFSWRGPHGAPLCLSKLHTAGFTPEGQTLTTLI